MVQVIKATGEKEQFSEEKVRRSIHRAGIPEMLQDEVITHIKSKLYENIPTSEIYRHILEFLDRPDAGYSRARYSLKQAIMALGPTGYPFEDYLAEILQSMGYETTTRSILMGSCVSHEIDVIARKDGKTSMIEAKFHNGPGTRTDVQVALYTKARFDDVKTKHNFDDVWLVTNTKTTIDAITYGQCTGMKIIGWSYPNNESLRDIVEKTKLIPTSAITSLSQIMIQQLLENGVILCSHIQKDPSLLEPLHLTEEKRKAVLDEVAALC